MACGVDGTSSRPAHFFSGLDPWPVGTIVTVLGLVGRAPGPGGGRDISLASLLSGTYVVRHTSLLRAQRTSRLPACSAAGPVR